MSAIAAIFYRESKLRFTNLGWMFWDLFYPLGYLLVFGVGITHALGAPPGLNGMDYNAFFLAGVLGMASFGIASNTAWGFFFDRDNGIFYEMLTYPLSRAQFLVGKVLFNLLLAVAQAAIAVGLAAALLKVPIRWELWPVLMVGIVGGTAGWFFFFTIFALKIRRNDLFNTVMSVFYFLFLRQLDVLSARAAAALVPHRGAAEPNHLASGLAALQHHRHRRAAADSARRGGLRGLLAGVVRLRRPLPPAAGITVHQWCHSERSEESALVVEVDEGGRTPQPRHKRPVGDLAFEALRPAARDLLGALGAGAGLGEVVAGNQVAVAFDE